MMTNRVLFILAAILFGVAFILELVGVPRFEMAFLFAGLGLMATGHAI